MRLADGGGGSNYSAINIPRLASLIEALGTASDTLTTKAPSLRAKASFWGIGESEFDELKRIGDWAGEQQPGLRRRLSLAKGIESGNADIGTVYLTEPVQSAAEAEQEGRELARRLAEHGRVDEENAELMHEIAQRLRYENDPDLLSAFFDELGPHYTQMIPSLLAGSGSATGIEDLEAYSAALAVAMRDVDPSSGFTEVTDSFTAVPDEGPIPATSWDRLAMVQHGDFPTEWLTAVVRTNALDSFARDPDQDFRGASVFDQQTTGLPDSTVALAFSALADDPRAARNALRTMGGPDHELSMEELTDLVYGMAASRGTGPDIADAFGLAIESGAGVHDEQAGEHSPPAASFAEDFITAAAGQDEAPWRIKDSLSAVAVSYSHEMVAGANMNPGVQQDVPGLSPAFGLGSEQVYGFLRGFAEDDQFTDPFDAAMGELYGDVLTEAARTDRADVAAGRQDPENFEFASLLFGNLAGLEFEAKEHVRGEMDQEEEELRALFKDIVTFPLGFVPGDQYLTDLGVGGAKLIWNVAQYGAGKGIDTAMEVDESATRVGQLENEEHVMVLSHHYVVAQSLLNADYPVTEMPPSVGTDGRLHDFDQIDPHAFQEWLAENTGSASFTSKVIQGDGLFLGGNRKAEEVAETYEENDD